MEKLKKFIVTVTLVHFSQDLFSAPLEIVDVKRNIPLAETEPVYKDFYIKVSNSSDLKKNQVVKASRKIIVKDASMKAVGDFMTTVGLLKIVQVSDTIAVAREFKLLPRDNEAMVDQIGIMVGDEIDTTDSFTDKTQPVKTSAAKIEVPTEKTAAAVTTEDI
ncbi:MAG: hypothetical protein H7Z71_07920 [Moraxellaceae bacterium]|nr:hypothetical protein [Pseudobdellovibrionaceae bacterium]